MTGIKKSATQVASEANQKNSDEKIKNKISAIKAIALCDTELQRLRDQFAETSPNRKTISLSQRWFSSWKGLDGELSFTGRNTDTYEANKEVIVKELGYLEEALKGGGKSKSTSNDVNYEDKYKELQRAQQIQFEDLLDERSENNKLREQIERLTAAIRELDEEKSELLKENTQLKEQNRRLKRARPSITVVKESD
ncbi:hypothetical protein ACOMICROBIO_NCLOACGD_00668 [Vibrio sp. B1ASS3]|uniref:hypothetical protein n=1 Tax=Vibrio sp. B1ASS3 TaxID=2751176 RepID=UPI001ABA98E2|nr:hypothetical protein [Vibrio sp. B1ASS3]CAD7800255.1 hypothetical protein ACOMICROBIO_NCLOACGD_00668 [Vibrio sp. B1ASS3]CAE6887199.1 hypothetical protein ACOMICROBIO_NCLOACGD_00668 [Vibrio sp. B1ASS3]